MREAMKQEQLANLKSSAGSSSLDRRGGEKASGNDASCSSRMTRSESAPSVQSGGQSSQSSGIQASQSHQYLSTLVSKARQITHTSGSKSTSQPVSPSVDDGKGTSGRGSPKSHSPPRECSSDYNKEPAFPRGPRTPPMPQACDPSGFSGGVVPSLEELNSMISQLIEETGGKWTEEDLARKLKMQITPHNRPMLQALNLQLMVAATEKMKSVNAPKTGVAMAKSKSQSVEADSGVSKLTPHGLYEDINTDSQSSFGRGDGHSSAGQSWSSNTTPADQGSTQTQAGGAKNIYPHLASQQGVIIPSSGGSFVSSGSATYSVASAGVTSNMPPRQVHSTDRLSGYQGESKPTGLPPPPTDSTRSSTVSPFGAYQAPQDEDLRPKPPQDLDMRRRFSQQSFGSASMDMDSSDSFHGDRDERIGRPPVNADMPESMSLNTKVQNYFDSYAEGTMPSGKAQPVTPFGTAPPFEQNRQFSSNPGISEPRNVAPPPLSSPTRAPPPNRGIAPPSPWGNNPRPPVMNNSPRPIHNMPQRPPMHGRGGPGWSF